MFSIGGFEITETIVENNRMRLYRARRESDRRGVLLKTGPADMPEKSVATRLQREFERAEILPQAAHPRLLSLERDDVSTALVLEDSGAQPLSALLDGSPQPASGLVPFAVQLIEALQAVHDAGFVHTHLEPASVLYNTRTGTVQVLDLIDAGPYPVAQASVQDPAALAMNPAYMAPELTGLSNRPVDYRADFYSAGVLLYECTTGRKPFDAETPHDWVKAHLLDSPVPPTKHVEDLPRMLEKLILKLLAKDPDKRYFTAAGLLADLREVGQIIDSGRTQRGFPLGREDMTPTLMLPGRLYERDEPLKALETAFQEVAQGGRQLVLIQGEAGSGKTGLARSLMPRVFAAGGYFAEGRFDLRGANEPYGAIAAAFSDLLSQILTENDERRQAWEDALREAIGDRHAVLSALVPELELLLGSAQPAPYFGPLQAQNRFNGVFIEFLKVFADADHPLVIFLDNLQWLDSATQSALHLALEHPEVRHLLIIGAIRSEDATADHPVMLSAANLREQGLKIPEITCEALSPDAIRRLVTDSLEPNSELRSGASQAEVTIRELTNLITVATQGNPFFIREFLLQLHAKRRLVLTVKQGQAEWRLENILPSDAVREIHELLRRRLQELPAETQDLLQYAAGIGNEFDLATLVYVTGKDREFAQTHLAPAIHHGFLTFKGFRNLLNAYSETERQFGGATTEVFEFHQNLVQEVCYELIDEDARRERHLAVGRLFLADLSTDERDAQIYGVLKHLNVSRGLIVEASENVSLTELNLAAGQKAKTQMAYGVALDFATMGFDLLEPNWWERRYKLTLTLYRERAELEYLHGNIDGGNDFFKKALAQARSDEDKADLYTMQVTQLSALGESEKAVQAGCRGLAQLGMRLPAPHFLNGNSGISKSVGDFKFRRQLQQEFLASRMKMGNKKLEDLGKLPAASDPEKRAKLQLLCTMLEPAYYANRDFWYLIATRTVSYALSHGVIAEAAPAFLVQGMMNVQYREDYQHGHELGIFAERLSRKMHNPAVQSLTSHFLATCLHPWAKNLPELENLLESGFKAGVRAGELHYSSTLLVDMSILLLIIGRPPEDIHAVLTRLRTFCRSMMIPVPLMARGMALLAAELQGDREVAVEDQNAPQASGERSRKSADDDPYQQFINTCVKHRDMNALATYLNLRGMNLALLGYADAAAEHFHEARPYNKHITGTLIQAMRSAFECFIAAERFRDAGFREKNTLKKTVAINLKELEAWSRGCPDNFRHLALMAQGSQARILGNHLEAVENFEQAALHAQQQRLPHFEGLAAEYAAKTSLRRGNGIMAASYASHARRAYTRWQSPEKLKVFQAEYQELLEELATAEK